MYGGTFDAGDLGPLGSQAAYLVHAFASPAGDPNHVIIEPPLDNAPDNITVLSGPIVADTATNTDYFFEDLAAQDDIRIKLNGGGSETVDDLPTVGPENLIFDGSNRSGGSNTLNVPVVVPAFTVNMTTDAAGDFQVQVGSGKVSVHGSTPADRMTVSDEVPAAGNAGDMDGFGIDDSALEGTLDVVANTSTSGVIGDFLTVTSTPGANLATDLIGGTGPNYFDIVHDALNLGINVTGGTGVNVLILDRVVSSASAPDSVAIAAIASEAGPELRVTGTTTSVIASDVPFIDADLYGGTLDVGDLSLVGDESVNVQGKASPAGDPNHLVIEPPLDGKPDDLSVDTGLSIDDAATGTNFGVTGFVAQDDVRIKLNGGGSETVNDLQTLGPYTLTFDGSNRSGNGNTLDVPLVVPGFVATVTTDAAGDPEFQAGGGRLSFHGSIPADDIAVTDDAPDDTTGQPTDTFDVDDDSALQGTLELVGNASFFDPVDDTFNVTNTAAAGLLTELIGGTGANDFDIVHGGVNQGIAILGGSGGNTLILDRPQTSAAAPDSLTLASGRLGPRLRPGRGEHHGLGDVHHDDRGLRHRRQYVRRHARRGRPRPHRGLRHQRHGRGQPCRRPESRHHRAPAPGRPGQSLGRHGAFGPGHGDGYRLSHHRAGDPG